MATDPNGLDCVYLDDNDEVGDVEPGQCDLNDDGYYVDGTVGVNADGSYDAIYYADGSIGIGYTDGSGNYGTWALSSYDVLGAHTSVDVTESEVGATGGLFNHTAITVGIYAASGEQFVTMNAEPSGNGLVSTIQVDFSAGSPGPEPGSIYYNPDLSVNAGMSVIAAMQEISVGQYPYLNLGVYWQNSNTAASYALQQGGISVSLPSNAVGGGGFWHP